MPFTPANQNIRGHTPLNATAVVKLGYIPLEAPAVVKLDHIPLKAKAGS